MAAYSSESVPLGQDGREACEMPVAQSPLCFLTQRRRAQGGMQETPAGQGSVNIFLDDQQCHIQATIPVTTE